MPAAIPLELGDKLGVVVAAAERAVRAALASRDLHWRRRPSFRRGWWFYRAEHGACVEVYYLERVGYNWECRESGAAAPNFCENVKGQWAGPIALPVERGR